MQVTQCKNVSSFRCTWSRAKDAAFLPSLLWPWMPLLASSPSAYAPDLYYTVYQPPEQRLWFHGSYPCTVKARGMKNHFYDVRQHLPDKAEILGLSFIIKYHNTLQIFSQDSTYCRCYRHFVRRILENAEYQWLPDDLPMSDKQTLGAYFTSTFTLWKSTVLTLLRISTDRHRAPFPPF
jgi:hypothetical protein